MVTSSIVMSAVMAGTLFAMFTSGLLLAYIDHRCNKQRAH